MKRPKDKKQILDEAAKVRGYHKSLTILLLVCGILFYLGLKVFGKELVLDPKVIILYLFSFIGATYYFQKVKYVCPACNGSLLRPRRRREQKFYPYCFHCGTHLFPDIKTKIINPENARLRPGFIKVLVGLAGTVVVAGIFLKMPALTILGGVVAGFVLLVAYMTSRGTQHACKSCHHFKGKFKFCENCGA